MNLSLGVSCAVKEQDIRPDSLTQIICQLSRADREKILKESQRFVSVCCPACRSERFKRHLVKDGFRFNLCVDCETLYINPRPSKELLHEYYRTAESLKFWNEQIFPASEDARRRHIFGPRALRVLELTRKYACSLNVLIGWCRVRNVL